MEKSKKKKLWLTCGIPGLGKSTWIQNHKEYFEGNVGLVSRDLIRFALVKDNEDYFSHEVEVWNCFVVEAKLSLLAKDNTVLDATHLNRRSRTKVLRALRNALKDVEVNILVFKGDADLAIKRNDKRKGVAWVPHGTIRGMAERMTIPTFEEGFDNIYIIDARTGGIKLIKRGE